MQGINGPLSGKMGPVVGYTWKGRPCLRTYRQHINYPNTAQQQKQRDWFVAMVRFAAQAKSALRLGLQKAAVEAQMTEGNYFVMKNKQHFSRTAEGVTVNYEKLCLAEGSVADVLFHEPRFEENEVLSIAFDRNSMFGRASHDDSVYLYIYNITLGEGFLSAPTTRRCKLIKAQLPTHWAGCEVHLYGFVVDHNGRASRTTYIGVGKVNHYEERGRYIPVNKKWLDFVDIANEANIQSHPGQAPDSADNMSDRPHIDIFGNPPEVP